MRSGAALSQGHRPTLAARRKSGMKQAWIVCVTAGAGKRFQPLAMPGQCDVGQAMAGGGDGQRPIVHDRDGERYAGRA